MSNFVEMLNTKKLALIMSLPANNPELCDAAFDAGADMVKVHINVDHRASGTHFGSLSEERSNIEKMLSGARGPLGLVVGGSLQAARADIDEVLQMPIGFLSAYAQNFPPCALGKIPLMAACDHSFSLEEARFMGKMGAAAVEASIIPGNEYGAALSLRDLLNYASIVNACGLPVVVPTQRAITPEDVPALIQCGVKGLMIGAVVTGKTAQSISEAIKKFRAAIEKA